MKTSRSMLLFVSALAACVAGSDEPDPAPGPVDDGWSDVPADDPSQQNPDQQPDQGCVDGWCDPGSDPDIDPTCEPRTCGDQCGTIDDGCGGTIACGPCGCQPTTCAEAGASCGTIDDGCGGTVSCDTDAGCNGACRDNQCVCAGDDFEPNDTDDEAVELGAITQGDGQELGESDLNLGSAEDADWFAVSITDSWDWLLSNPTVHVSVDTADGGDVDLIAYYFCDYGPDFDHSCEQSSAYSDDFGSGCQGTTRVSLSTSCDWDDESGTLYIRVAPGEQAVACESYSVTVEAT